MTNTNCLIGMKCPKCESLEPFHITVTATARVYDDGIEGIYDSDWDTDSYCFCRACGHAATVADFYTKTGTPT